MKKLRSFLILAAAMFPGALSSQTAMESIKTFTVPLQYVGKPEPNGLKGDDQYTEDRARVANVVHAELFVYLPASQKPASCVVICPGGGYARLAIDHEGHKAAEKLAANGIAAVVLKYRMPNGHNVVPLTEAQNAIRQVRSMAREWNINPDKVGIMGFSAGGNLASTASVHYKAADPSSKNKLEQYSSRPDFSVILYGVVSMRQGITHAGSRMNLLGANPDEATVKYFSADENIESNTPPACLILVDDDTTVSPMNSILYYTGLKKHGIPAEMHIWEEGGHGFGMNKKNLPVDIWSDIVLQWKHLY